MRADDVEKSDNERNGKGQKQKIEELTKDTLSEESAPDDLRNKKVQDDKLFSPTPEMKKKWLEQTTDNLNTISDEYYKITKEMFADDFLKDIALKLEAITEIDLNSREVHPEVVFAKLKALILVIKDVSKLDHSFNELENCLKQIQEILIQFNHSKQKWIEEVRSMAGEIETLRSDIEEIITTFKSEMKKVGRKYVKEPNGVVAELLKVDEFLRNPFNPWISVYIDKKNSPEPFRALMEGYEGFKKERDDLIRNSSRCGVSSLGKSIHKF